MHPNISMQMAVAILVAALILAPLPDANAGSLTLRTPGVSGDTSSDGAIITVALFATVCAVMLLIGLKADYENVFTKKTEPPPVYADDVTEQELRKMAATLDHSVGTAVTEERSSAIAVAWQVKF